MSASQSSTVFDASLAIDGNNATTAATACSSTLPNDTNAWLAIDLKGRKYVAGMRMFVFPGAAHMLRSTQQYSSGVCPAFLHAFSHVSTQEGQGCSVHDISLVAGILWEPALTDCFVSHSSRWCFLLVFC